MARERRCRRRRHAVSEKRSSDSPPSGSSSITPAPAQGQIRPLRLDLGESAAFEVAERTFAQAQVRVRFEAMPGGDGFGRSLRARARSPGVDGGDGLSASDRPSRASSASGR